MEQNDLMVHADPTIMEQAEKEAIRQFSETKASLVGEEAGLKIGDELGYYYGFCESILEESEVLKHCITKKSLFY